ncbi:MAG: glycosyltransferase family 2 protein [Hyphomicrobiales bacterium]|nr:glycosyltransferase family 2 protein [Hyphomicrobiales bacterium]
MPGSSTKFGPCRVAISSSIAPIAVNSWRFYAAAEIGLRPVSTHVRNFVNSGDLVLVAIPCFNEEEHIADILENLLAEGDEIRVRIVVADGGSTDRTRAIVEKFANEDGRVLLLDNPRRVQSVAVNEVVRVHGQDARFLLRVDAHAEYPRCYCEHLLAVRAATDADSVVVSMHTKGKSCFQRAAAAAQNSLLGNGGSSHRNTTRDRWVDHGHHALMTLAAFKAVGGYDESFSHNEDAELDARLTEQGYRIFLTGEVPIVYYPRRNPVALFRQYFNIGRGRARNLLKHRRGAKLRHFVLAVVAPAILLLLLAPFVRAFALPALAWSLLCIGYGITLGVRLADPCAAASGLAAMMTQAGWSFGFWAEIVERFGQRAKPLVRHARKRFALLSNRGQIAP